MHWLRVSKHGTPSPFKAIIFHQRDWNIWGVEGGLMFFNTRKFSLKNKDTNNIKKYRNEFSFLSWKGFLFSVERCFSYFVCVCVVILKDPLVTDDPAS